MGIDALIGSLLSGLGDLGGAAVATDIGATTAADVVAGTVASDAAMISAAAPLLDASAAAAGLTAADLGGSFAALAATPAVDFLTGAGAAAAADASAAFDASVLPSTISAAATPGSVIGTSTVPDITGALSPLSTSGGGLGGIGGAVGSAAPATVGTVSPDLTSVFSDFATTDLTGQGVLGPTTGLTLGTDPLAASSASALGDLPAADASIASSGLSASDTASLASAFNPTGPFYADTGALLDNPAEFGTLTPASAFSSGQDLFAPSLDQLAGSPDLAQIGMVQDPLADPFSTGGTLSDIGGSDLSGQVAAGSPWGTTTPTVTQLGGLPTGSFAPTQGALPGVSPTEALQSAYAAAQTAPPSALPYITGESPSVLAGDAVTTPDLATAPAVADPTASLGGPTAGGVGGATTPAGEAGAATTLTSTTPGATTGQGFLGTLGSQLAKNPLQDLGLAAGAGGILYDVMRGTPKPPGYGALEAQAAQANSQSQLMESYLATGTLPPGMQAALTAATNSAQAAIKAQYANAGMSGSSAETQALQTAQQTAVTQGANIALQLYSQGLSQAQLADQIYSTIMQTAIQQDAALSSAVGNFAGALAGSSMRVPATT